MVLDLTPRAVFPFYFGSPAKRLFGAYYSPAPGHAQECGVVLCNPGFQAYIRAHRAMHRMALHLAQCGFPVLRFDYFGTGDSAGDDQEASLAQWQNDLRSAIQELSRKARVDRVYLVGLQLGATLAAVVAAGRNDVEGVVLWEPVVNGVDHIRELQDWHEEKLFFFLNQGARQASSSGEITELLGFGVSQAALAELGRLDLLALQRKPADRILLIESQPHEAVARLQTHLQSLGTAVTHRLIDGFNIWLENPDKGLVPQAVIQATGAWFGGEGS